MSAGLTFPRSVKSEWIKFRTLRSTWITYAVALLIADGLGALATFLHGRELHDRGLPAVADPTSFTLRGIMFAQLAIGVVGVLYITGEYATGMIRASATAAPKRTPILAGKVVVFALFTAVVSLLLAFVAFFVGQSILSQWHYDVALSYPGALRAVLGAAFYILCVGIMGLGIGFALRNTGGAIATLFGLVLVAPLLVQALPQSWQDHINKYLPINIAESLIRTGPADPGSTSLAMWANFTVLGGYAVLAVLLGWLVLKRRDV